MIQYASTRGKISPVDFDEAVLSGFAADGGLFVPQTIPVFSREELYNMQTLSYQEMAFTIVEKYIDSKIIPQKELRPLIRNSFQNFSAKEITPVTNLAGSSLYIQELFHGPTLSFKDIAMGFLINCLEYFLVQRGERLSLILATTGDTGPAAAHAAAGKTTLECWPLYPLTMISEEQARQMTTLNADNVHPVGVEGCINGGDDLDIVVARLFADENTKKELQLSSVNSINWCRVMMQTVHYFYGYFKVVDEVGEKVSFSVPTGAFGNLCAGYLARAMGLPVENFICATNENGTLYRVFEKGIFSKRKLKQTISSAIDIVLPYNFWRFLHFNRTRSRKTITEMMAEFEQNGQLVFDASFWQQFRRGFASYLISDPETLKTIQKVWEKCGYLLDPHGAVAVTAAEKYTNVRQPQEKIVCLATAHPAKFPDIVQRAIGCESVADLSHPILEQQKHVFQHLRTCQYKDLEQALVHGIKQQLHG